MPEFDSLLQYNVEDTTDESSFRQSVIQDFWICCVSREVSLLGRREVLTGKAKFGILGDGKEVPQVAMARAWRKGDWRAGYYRDQTLIFALGIGSVADYFAQLYADAENDPWSGGRQMNAHFATRSVNPDGTWADHTAGFNTSADISPTAGQMGRALGLSLASKYYRQFPEAANAAIFSDHGNEVSFCTVGDASTSEGVFWETMNAAAVQQVPLAVSVWDDGYGISVPRSLQTAKDSISKAISGMATDGDGNGIDIYNCKAWDYPGLCEMYERGIKRVRETHVPALFHIEECTQPQGHSTSGSHERYKSKDRLSWEDEVDCIKVMGDWMIETGIMSEEEITDVRKRAKKYVREEQKRAWERLINPVEQRRKTLLTYFDQLQGYAQMITDFEEVKADVEKMLDPRDGEILAEARKLYFRAMHVVPLQELAGLRSWIDELYSEGVEKYQTNLYSDDAYSALKVAVVPPEYDDEGKKINGYQVLNAFFDKVFTEEERMVAFGEDVGKIGDVNQGFSGLQDKFGAGRIFDTGIREWTIVGQAIGMAMRGIRPIAEIQYLDYLVYGLAPLSDDLATLRYRSNGLQQAPAIIRSRGHRLEGIWHTGSPMSLILGSMRGIYVCVPRNMVQAAGMYRTLLQSNDPAIVIECLNGYRKKEFMPSNIGEYTIPLGVPEVIREGTDVTIVSYGSVLHEIAAAGRILADLDISVEVIDVQTLLPFDLEGIIARSIEKTSRVVFVDEDVPGGASAYMMSKVLEEQQAYALLDSPPVTLTGTDNRSAYGSDGDYFTKPSTEDIVQAVYRMMREVDPGSYPVGI